MSSCPFHDAFAEQRKKGDAMPINFEGEEITMLLGFEAVRDAARDFRAFTSNTPFRVPIPSEETMRSVRQLPIETDPPEHSQYVRLIKPFFQRPRNPDYIAEVESILREMLEDVSWEREIEIVRDFALPLQSQALTLLLNTDPSEADVWTGWGIHVFHDGDGEEKGDSLEDYIHRKLDEAETHPEGEDIFSALTYAELKGRKLTRDEQVGFINLAFAGGRDTIIHSVAALLVLVSEQPEILEALKENDDLVDAAAEEFFRMTSVLTHIGRTNVEEGDVFGVPTPEGRRVSLCWASANFDESVFENPTEFRLDREDNPHIAFGTGVHACAGADHARAIIRSLFRILAELELSIEILEKEEHIEVQNDYTRRNGYDRLVMKIGPRAVRAR
ncbi:MAG: cytochrome P450 [Verrucomicrobiota bacterium]